MDQIKQDSILWVKTITELNQINSLMCIVEDEEGEPVVLSMYNQISNLIGLDYMKRIKIAS